MLAQMLHYFIPFNSGIVRRQVLCDSNAPGAEVTKLFFMLNSAEHEICPADKSQITNNCIFFFFFFVKQS